MRKSRDYVNSSALGSYFGVGFNTPNEQIEIDLGNVIPEFDDESKDRMALGNHLEDSVINYFEDKLNIKITDRNSQLLKFYDEKLRGKLDGMTYYQGKETVVEIKVSNSKYKKFTENMGYILQCQAYMLATDTQQALLCGLYQGKPIMGLIERDEEIINDIKDMTDFIYNVLIGLEDFANYPTEILEKYSTIQILEPLENFTPKDEEDALNLLVLKEKEKALKSQIRALEASIKDEFEAGKFENDYLVLSVSNGTRKGGLDEDALAIYLASNDIDVDLTKFRKPSSHYKTIRIKDKR